MERDDVFFMNARSLSAIDQQVQELCGHKPFYANNSTWSIRFRAEVKQNRTHKLYTNIGEKSNQQAELTNVIDGFLLLLL